MSDAVGSASAAQSFPLSLVKDRDPQEGVRCVSKRSDHV